MKGTTWLFVLVIALAIGASAATTYRGDPSPSGSCPGTNGYRLSCGGRGTGGYLYGCFSYSAGYCCGCSSSSCTACISSSYCKSSTSTTCKSSLSLATGIIVAIALIPAIVVVVTIIIIIVCCCVAATTAAAASHSHTVGGTAVVVATPAPPPAVIVEEQVVPAPAYATTQTTYVQADPYGGAGQAPAYGQQPVYGQQPTGPYGQPVNTYGQPNYTTTYSQAY